MRDHMKMFGSGDRNGPKTSIVHYSDDEIEQEVARRKRLRETMPKPKDTIDYGLVLAFAKETIKDIDIGEFDNDTHSTMFEIVMESIYGPDVWAWIQEKRKED